MGIMDRESSRADLPVVATPTPIRRRFPRPRRLRAVHLSQPPIEEGWASEVQRRNAAYRRVLAGTDVTAIGLALILGCVALAGGSLQPVALLAPPLVVLAAKIYGLYDRDELVIHKSTIDQAPQLFHLATLYTLLIFVFDDILVGVELATGEILAIWTIMFLLSVIGRWLGRTFIRSWLAPQRCVFVGSDAAHDRLAAKLAAYHGRAELVGRMTLRDSDAHAGTRLRSLIAELRAHRVIIEPSDTSPQLTIGFVREAKATGVPVSLLPRVLDVVGSSIEIEDVDGMTVLGVRRFGLTRSSVLTKRSFDLCGTTVGLLLLFPLFALVALLIRLESRGPVFYRQARVGRDGQVFEMWKFRSMVDGAHARREELRGQNEAGEGLFKIAADPRVTRVGRWLRRYSLDELPQLVNVLKGQMSLVGPRPLVADEDVQIIGHDRRRLDLTPGMTGHWQILGSARIPLAEMVKLDYLYVAGWSLWADVKILLRTVPYVLARRGM